MLNKRSFSILFFISVFAVDFFCFFESQARIDQPKIIISFLGAPGVGKGTLAGQCTKGLNCSSLSVGNLLREAIAQGTSLGKEVECIKEGKLASDELVVALVEEWLTKNFDTIDTLILDGFPRTVRQAALFLNLLHTKFDTIVFRVVNLIITDEMVMVHLANRLVCAKCQAPESQLFLKDSAKLLCQTCGGNLVKREDDTIEVIKNRFNIYAEHAESLLEFYRKSTITIDYIDVDSKTPEQVFNEFKDLFQRFFTQDA